MGACESTASPPSDRTPEEEEEEKRRFQQNIRTVVKAGAAIAGGAAAAWGIYKMISRKIETELNHEAMMLGHRVSVTQFSDDTNERQHLNMNGSYQTERRWCPPPRGCLKMNTDAGCRPSHQHDSVLRGPSGYGGILRDHVGKCVGGFLGFIGDSDCLTAEIKGILTGLRLLDRLGLVESIIESDSDAAIGWITVEKNPNNRHRSTVVSACLSEIMECKRLILKNRITVRSCGREANKCADKLAAIAIVQERPYQEFKVHDVPSEIRSIVDGESSRVW